MGLLCRLHAPRCLWGECLRCSLMAAALKACFRILRILQRRRDIGTQQGQPQSENAYRSKWANMSRRAAGARWDDNLLPANLCEGRNRLMCSGYHHGVLDPETPGNQLGWTSHCTNLSRLSEASLRGRALHWGMYVEQTGSINLRRARTRTSASHLVITNRPLPCKSCSPPN